MVLMFEYILQAIMRALSSPFPSGQGSTGDTIHSKYPHWVAGSRINAPGAKQAKNIFMKLQGNKLF